MEARAGGARADGMNTNRHILRAYDSDLADMRAAVVSMARLAEQQFLKAVEAALSGEHGRAVEVLDGERELNDQHLRLDATCNQIIARHQPTAIDLREVIGVIHTINDLERIGDEAKKIALRVRSLDPAAVAPQLAGLRRMAARTADMLNRAIDAFERHDPRAAAELASADDEVDAMRSALTRELVERMSREPARVASLFEAVLVVQSIERIADHAENVAEYIVNVVEGVDTRHGSVPT